MFIYIQIYIYIFMYTHTHLYRYVYTYIHMYNFVQFPLQNRFENHPQENENHATATSKKK